MKKYILIILTAISIVSCHKKSSSEKEKIKAATWLLGKWESKTPEGSLKENWTQENDSTFVATSYFINDKDTVHFETIQLQQKGEFLSYSTTIKGQNNDKAVIFPLASSTEKQLVFENAKNDYPQKITYTLITKDSLIASISGVQLGKPSSEKFGMKKSE